MSASLVGSEMCIRDRPQSASTSPGRHMRTQALAHPHRNPEWPCAIHRCGCGAQVCSEHRAYVVTLPWGVNAMRSCLRLCMCVFVCGAQVCACDRQCLCTSAHVCVMCLCVCVRPCHGQCHVSVRQCHGHHVG
eukprot:15443961-Alexandrium_andersonii.AAC.1